MRVFRTLVDYVQHLGELENDDGPTSVAAPFLPSHLFDKNALIRFFTVERVASEEARWLAEELWSRRQFVHAAGRQHPYRDIVELAAFNAFCSTGTVHPQTEEYRATPHEVVVVLEAILTLTQTAKWGLAFCSETLPFPFIVRDRSVTIDVRTNHAYQRIQGLVLHEPEAVATFGEEFERIWHDEGTVSGEEDVAALIERRLREVQSGFGLLRNRT